MNRILATLAALLLITAGAFAQTGSTAPVVWERYKVSDRKISFLLPKMPTVHQVPSICGELKSVTYLAYARNVVYEVTIAGPRRSATQVNCGGKIVSYSPRKLDDRLAELRKGDRFEEQTVRVGEADSIRFTSKRITRWIFPNQTTPARWVELAVSHYAYDKLDLTQFFESLNFTATDGKEIGDGSPVTLGDEGVKSSAAAESMFLGSTTYPLTLYWKDTDFLSARIPKEAAGLAVVLRIKFLANGSVGSIVPDKQLPDGLTDIAIAAARKISFLPKRRNFLAIDDEQSIQYTFRPL